MKIEKLFEEFESCIEKKYEHMADSMFALTEDFPIFFYENEIMVNELSQENIKELFEDYLNYDELTEAESAMIFQLLIEFCNYCKEKNIDVEFFRKYLLKNKSMLFEQWQYFEEDGEENTSDAMDPEFLDNFDEMYPALKIAMKGKKPDISKIKDFLEKTHKIMKSTYEESVKIRKENPDINDAEYNKKLEEVIIKKHGKVFADFNQSPDEIMQTVVSLPKETAKKFFEFTFNLENVSDFKFGSVKRKEIIEKTLNDLQDIINDVEKIK
ncbi:MAG: hypothetical protein ABH879_04650 [archaeon]